MTSPPTSSIQQHRAAPKPSHQEMYETDFAEWINEAAALMKQGKFSELALENLIDEVATLGSSEKNALRSNLCVLLIHLLKWQYQPSKRTNSWKATIREHRNRIQETFEDSPSLKNYYEQVFNKSYSKAQALAADETGLDIDSFPAKSPYSLQQVLDHEFLPKE
ncbi:MAG: DUF29 domain-containing protein [Thermosynechococcaceae cyanobacterium]